MRAHDRDNLGVTRRVLPSRLWSGKTVDQHKADRAEVVRQTLLSAGMDDLDLDRMAATRHPARRVAAVRLDRHPARPRHLRHASSSTPSANGNAGAPSTSTPRPSPPVPPQEFRQLPSRRDRPGLTTARPHPMTRQHRAGGLGVRGERSESRSDGDSRP